MEKLRWQKYGLIDICISSDEVERGRPYPHMVYKIMRQFEVNDPKYVAKVGDTELDIREGHNAGCKFTVGITTGPFTYLELEKYAPTHIIGNISQFLDILDVEHSSDWDNPG